MNLEKELKLMIYESSLDNEYKEDLLNIVESTDDEEILSEVIDVLEASKEEYDKLVEKGQKYRNGQRKSASDFSRTKNAIKTGKYGSQYDKMSQEDKNKYDIRKWCSYRDHNVVREFHRKKDIKNRNKSTYDRASGDYEKYEDFDGVRGRRDISREYKKYTDKIDDVRASKRKINDKKYKLEHLKWDLREQNNKDYEIDRLESLIKLLDKKEDTLKHREDKLIDQRRPIIVKSSIIYKLRRKYKNNPE